MPYEFVKFEPWQEHRLLHLLRHVFGDTDETITITLTETIRKHQYDSLWYGGHVATVQFGKKVVELEACGDVSAYLIDRKAQSSGPIEFIKDKNNAGELGDMLQSYIRTDKELRKLLRGSHRRYIMELGDSNCWECIPTNFATMAPYESWITEASDIWNAIVEMVHVVLSDENT